MKTFIGIVLSSIFAFNALAAEKINVISYTGPAGTISMFGKKLVDVANEIQSDYQFNLVSKPGAGGLVAVQEMNKNSDNSIVAVSAGFVDQSIKGKLNESDYVVVSSLGDACWVLVSDKGSEKDGITSLKGVDKLNVGSIAHGSSVHLSSLKLGDYIGFKVTNVVFKSTIEAMTLMATDKSVNFIIDNPRNFLSLKSKFPNLNGLGVSCDMRNPIIPEVKTFTEQGYVNVPNIWSVLVANKSMPESKRAEISNILDRALAKIGQNKILEQFNFKVPQLNGISSEKHFELNKEVIRSVRTQFSKELN